MQKRGGWARFRRPFSVGLALGAFLFLMPLLTLGAQNQEVETLPASPTPVPEQSAQPEQWDAKQTLRVLQKDGEVEEMTMADYLWRVVAAEMPATFAGQALRAQAVCARTYSLWKVNAGSHSGDGADICADSTCCQAYISPEDAAQRWGAASEEYASAITQAVADTDGFILTYEERPIQAVFFSSSAAATEDAAAVWGSSVPYLVSVDSPEGDDVPNYHSAVALTAEEVRALAEEAGLGADLSGDPSAWFSGLTRTASGRVASVELGGVTLSGGAARSLFSLRSTCFSVSQAEGVFTFSVTGYGHGVGMSQYGADAMARSGSGWRDILTHYYTGVDIQPAGQLEL